MHRLTEVDDILPTPKTQNPNHTLPPCLFSQQGSLINNPGAFFSDFLSPLGHRVVGRRGLTFLICRIWGVNPRVTPAAPFCPG